MFDIKKEVLLAEKRIREHIRETPLDHSIALSELTKCNLFFKCENLQYTNSFKVRGALNKLLNLTSAQLAQGVVAASSGNHGAAVAFGLNKINANGIIFVPENASPAKIDNIRNYTKNLRFYGTDCAHTEMYAREYAKQHNMIYLSPYNDQQTIGGQGTIGYELMNQLDDIDVVFVAVGGGGLISGIAGYLKAVKPSIKVIGCLPKNSPVLMECVKAGRVIEMETLPTLSDATAGGVESGSITLDICREMVDDYILVSEEEIKVAMIHLIKMQHLLVEGASGVALAALLKKSDEFCGKNVVVLLSGANVSLETLKFILA